jgi:hypothetical protein
MTPVDWLLREKTYSFAFMIMLGDWDASLVKYVGGNHTG